LIVGGNALAHLNTFSDARGQVERQHLTLKRKIDLLEKCKGEGVNTLLGRGSSIIFDLLDEYVTQTGQSMNFIAHNAHEIGPYRVAWNDPRIFQNTLAGLRAIVEWSQTTRNPPIAIYLSGVVINPVVEQRKTELIPEWLEIIREQGFLAGIGCHYHYLIDLCEDHGYDPDFYVITFNHLGVECSTDFRAISHSIQSTRKPVIVFKILGGGRIPPRLGFRQGLRAIKPSDFVMAGMAFREEVIENAQIIRELTHFNETENTK
jgi:hypothetical protein